MEPLKHRINRDTIAALAADCAAVDPDFDAAAFCRDAHQGLSKLELKARINQVADTLRQHLNQDYPKAVKTLVKALPKAAAGDDEIGAFTYWPVASFVERHGLQHPRASWTAMREITKRMSCEFAVRPFLEEDLADGLARLLSWTKDKDPRVRRLCSEGTRPRLPWGPKLRAVIEDPALTVPILDALVDDESLFVRRSVANHLGDIAKDHAAFAVQTATRWNDAPTAHRRWVIKHGLRHLIKQGDPGALALLGYPPARVTVRAFTAKPKKLRIGESTAITLDLASAAKKPQALLVDYVVHFQKKTGRTSPKVFKWKELTLAPAESVTLHKKQSFVERSTRTHHPGAHRIELQVNGQVLADTSIRLMPH